MDRKLFRSIASNLSADEIRQAVNNATEVTLDEAYKLAEQERIRVAGIERKLAACVEVLKETLRGFDHCECTSADSTRKCVHCAIANTISEAEQ